MVNGMADGEPRKSGGSPGHWCSPQTLCPLGAYSSNGGIWGHSKRGMPFFFSGQGPLLKGGGDVGGEYPGEIVFVIFVRMSRGRDVFTSSEAYEF